MKKVSASRVAAYSTGTLFFLSTPLISFAQGSTLFSVGKDSATQILTIIQTLVQIAFLSMLVFFFWGLAKYIYGGAEDKEKGRNLMIWGTVAIFVAASIWGIVNVLKLTFGIGNEQTGYVPLVI